jgi:hypothetical protein
MYFSSFLAGITIVNFGILRTFILKVEEDISKSLVLVSIRLRARKAVNTQIILEKVRTSKND